MKPLVKEWVIKAEKDFLVAQREYESLPPEYDAVCFHSQQCVEKYLKALLQDENIYFEKTHDLDVLLEKAKNILPQLMEHKKQAVKLSSFAVEIRYPGVEATQEEAHLCLGIAEELRKVIRGHLGGEV